MTIWLWIGFLVFVVIMLALDLGVLHRKEHVIGVREALLWTFLVAVLAVAFSGVVYFMYDRHWLGIGLPETPVAASPEAVPENGPLPDQESKKASMRPTSGRDAAMQFLAGYIIEQSLSLDNMFVFALIFTYFCVPPLYQHRVLFWGILGALIMRAAMILAGVALVERFAWTLYVFGGLLFFTALKMLFSGEGKVEPERNILVRLARLFYPVSPGYDGHNFFTRMSGKRAITPLFIVLLVIESTDVLFAVDSIPAIFAITQDPFIIFTSNVFAILCLRSMYFAIAGMMRKFKYLKISLVVVLLFVSVKMLLHEIYHVEVGFSLAFIGTVLAVGIFGSLMVADRAGGSPTPGDEGAEETLPVSKEFCPPVIQEPSEHHER